ncbi:hypothetical protein GOODEAATRI_014693, partial [Goodea atripinnis]
MNLNEVFIGEKKETPLNNIPAEAKERLQEKTEEESEGNEENMKPDFTQVLNNTNSSSPSKECETRSNGHSEESEEDLFVGLNGDLDSFNSSLTKQDPASLKTSSSNGSLHSSYT